MTDTNPQNAQVGVIDPATGQPHPTSGPSGGPTGPGAAGTQARDVATRGTAHASDGPSGGGSTGGSGGAQSKAQDAAGSAQEKVQDAAGAAQEKAQEAASQAQEKAQQAAGQARTQIREQLDQRSTQAGERATATAGDLRSISDQLRDQGNEAPAKLADSAALQIEKVGSYLQRTDGSSLLHDVERFARSNPWATALGGLAVGFAASRALKASSGDRHRASTSSTSATSATSGGAPAGGPPPSYAPVTSPATTASPATGVGTSAGVGTGAPLGGSPSRLGTANDTPPFGAVGDEPGTLGGTGATGYSIPSGAPGQPGTATNPTDSQTGS